MTIFTSAHKIQITNRFRFLLVILVFTLGISTRGWGQTYCDATGLGREYILGVLLDDGVDYLIYNVTDYASAGYTNYTSTVPTPDLTIGVGYNLGIYNGNAYGGDLCGIWIDWNGDGDFNDPDETIDNADLGGGASFGAIITPPLGAKPGNTRMRIRIHFTDEATSSCDESVYGEVEDYTINIVTCTDPSITSHPNATPQTVCLGDGATSLSVTASSTLDISYQWYSNSNQYYYGSTLIPGAIDPIYTPSTAAAGTFYYYCVVSNSICTLGSNISGAVTVSAANTAGTPSSSPITCINAALSPVITITTTGATGIWNDGVAGANGLPAGVSAHWASNTITISGTPTASGTFNYSIPLTGGCGTVNATGTITVILVNTVGLPSSSPTLCINTLMTNITHTTTGATGIGAATGLPAGVTAAWATNTITISGTPNASGTFNYSIPLTGGCGVVNATGTITVTANNTVARTSAVGTDAQTVCINAPITNITYSTTGATGATVTNLPAGVTGVWAANVVTISGTPTVAGAALTYTVTLTGGCGVITTTGTIAVTPNNTVARTSAVGTDAQTVCINTPITNITYSTTGATGATVTNLPAGVTGVWAANVVTISGTPTVAGAALTYTVTLTGGCGVITTTGTITVTANNTVARTSAVGTDAQTACINTPITNITYSTTGATGATVNNLPAGVTGVWAANVVTISGTPTVAGAALTYTVTLTGGCGVITTTGTITVTANNTVARTSAVGTDAQTACINTPITNITYSTTGATGATVTNLPAGVTGVWAANVVTISGTPTVAGAALTYTVTLTGGCGVITTTGTITVITGNSVARTSAVGTDAQTVCINTPITNITYATTGATGATVTNLPAGVTGVWASNVVTISGTPTVAGAALTYTVTLTGGCGNITTTGTIAVTTNNTVTLTSAAGTNAQTACVNTPITNITYATTGATGAAVTNLPAGVTGVWASNVVTISGTPTVAGAALTYTVTLTGGCGNITTTGTIAVNSNNTVTLTSAVGTNAQTACVNTPITNITYATTGATGAAVTNLPAGVTGVWASNVVTISGTPTVAGAALTYTVTLTGGCGNITTTGTIAVNSNNTVTLTSAAGTNAQTACVNTPITNITYATTGATGAAVTNLPTGVTGVWSGNVVTISGTPTVAGAALTYTVTLTGGCGNITTTGTIAVNSNNTVTLTSAVGTNAQTACVNTPITNITYATTGATGAAVTNLPAGVTGVWSGNVVTISGTPTVAGAALTYTVTLTGGCGNITTTGTIAVITANTVTLTSAAGTNAQTACVSTPITNITYATTGATGAAVTNLPTGITGVWSGNVVTISGTPTVVGAVRTYTVTLTGGCGNITTTGTIAVNSNNTVTLTSPAGTNAQTACVSTPITNITYATTGATGAAVTNLPTGVTGVWSGNVVTISGTPTVAGAALTYTVTLTGGCGNITTTGTIVVNSNNTVTLTSAAGTNAQTVCVNTPITNITYATTGATGAAVTNLPTGVTGVWSGNVVTISGTPTVAGVAFTYTVTLTGGCSSVNATGTINVTAANTASAPSSSPTPCINTLMTNITHTTTGATSIGAATGLPGGVSATWASNTITISGTPTASGTFNYSIPLNGGCGSANAAGTITVSTNPVVQSVTICQGGSGSLTSPSCPGGGTFSDTFNAGAGTDNNTYGTSAWSTPDNITATGSPYATQNLAPDVITHYLQASNYGFAIPANATINGITVVIRRQVATTGSMQDDVVRLLKAGTVTGSNLASGTSWPNSFGIATYGGAGNLWGTTWSAAEINASNFGVVLAAHHTSSQTRQVDVDYLQITVTYTITGTINWYTVPLGGTSIGSGSPFNPVGVPGSGLLNTNTPGIYTFWAACSSAPDCRASGTFTITPVNTATLTSGAGTDIQAVCVNTAITPITYTTTGATGATVTGLPAGVTGSWNANVVTITGTPTTTTGSPFNYTVTLTGGCGTVTKAGTITVTTINTAGLPTSNPPICINTALTPVTIATTTATGISNNGVPGANGLPAGVSASWASNTITISGTPSASGIFNYSIPLTGGCGSVNATGTITVSAVNTVSAASFSPTLCSNTLMTGITHTTTGATGIGAATGLPAGVTAAFASNTITISGTPTASGTFSYSIPLTGGCGSINATGTITVNPQPSMSSANSVVICSGAAVGLTLTGTLPSTYSWIATDNANVTGESLTPQSSGTINDILTNSTTSVQTVTYTVVPTSTTGNCQGTPQTVTVTVNPKPTVTNNPLTQTICSGGSTTLVTFTSDVIGTTFAWTATATPGVTGFTASGTGTIPVQTISTTGTLQGTVTYVITPTAAGCAGSMTNYTVLVNPKPTVTNNPLTQTICSGGSTTQITLTSDVSGTTFAWTATATPGVTGFTASGTGTIPVQTISTTGTLQGTVTYAITPTAAGCAGTVTNYTVLVNPTATITSQSTATQIQCIGGTFTAISVTAIGPAPITYQWYSNNVSNNSGGFDLGSGNGAQTSSYTPQATLVGTLYYYCVVVGCGTNVTSAISGAFIVNPATAITSQITAGQTLCIGGTFTAISVTASGTAPITYQWFKNTIPSNTGGTLLSGATGASYTPSSGTAGTLYYYCVVHSGCGSDVTSAVSEPFIVNPGTTISSQSTGGQTQCINGTFSAISVLAGGTAPVEYQWYSNTTASNSGGTPIPGAISASYIPSAASAGTRYYYCIVRSGCGSEVTSAVSGAFVVNTTTVITGQLTDPQTVCLGGSFTPITITATGSGTLTYQWYRNTIPSTSGGTFLGSANGAQTSSYTPQATSVGTYYYYSVVSGTCGTVTSAISGAFIVTDGTVISSQSTNGQTKCINETFTPITVTASGTGALNYQWYSNLTANNTGGTPIGTNSASYTPSSAVAGTLYYYCIVTGSCGTATSIVSGAFIVNPATAISSQSTAGQNQCLNGSFTPINVTATGSGTLTYQWYSNNTPVNSGGNAIGGATGASFTPPASAIGTLYYYVTVHSFCGSDVTSDVSGPFTVDPATIISNQSTAGQNQCINGSFTPITVTASGFGTLNYQWYSNTVANNSGGTPLGSANGAQTSSYTPQATSVGTLYYYCVVSTTCGTATSAVSGAFNVTGPTTILSQSTAGQNQCTGGTFIPIYVTATGTGTLTYQWYSNEIASNSDGKSIPGATGASYTPSTATAGTLWYYCIVHSDCGNNVTSAVSGAFVVTDVTVNAGAALADICKGGTSAPLGGSVGGGATGGTWSSSVGGTFSPSANLSDNPAWTPPSSFTGTATLTLTTSGPCASASAAKNIVVHESKPVSVSIAAVPSGPVCTGASVTFTAVPVNGGTAPAYQWQVNGSPVGTNSSTYSYNPANNDQVKCVVTSNDPCASGNPATSNVITMTVNSTLPASLTIAASANPVCEGTSVTFTAIPVNGGTTPTFQWKVNGTISGTNNASYTYTPASGDQVTCILTSDAACASGSPATSNMVAMVVNPNLPVSVSITASGNPVCAGTSVTFTATPFNGGSTPTYQWKKGGANIAGATGYTYTTSALASGDVITVEMNSTAICATGSPATSNALTMTVNPNLPASVSIAAVPPGAICSGTPVTFTATPVNGGTPTYQWYKGTMAVGANSATYDDPALANGDVIKVVMTSSLACTTGSPATSNVLPMVVNPNLPASVTFTVVPSGTICEGTSVTFTAIPVNGGAPAFQWWKGTNPIPGETGPTFTSNTLANGDKISVEMTSSLTCATPKPATSSQYTMSFYAPLTVDAGPDLSIPNGTSIIISNATAFTIPSSSLTYSWTPAALFVNPALLNPTTVNLTATNIYTLTVTDLNGCVKSDQMTITVTGSGLAVNPTATPSVVCAGSTVQLNANASGGLNNKTYTWSSNPAGFSSDIANPSVNPAVTTTYTVSVNDGSNSANGNVTVTVNDNPTVTVNSPAVCASTGSATITATPSPAGTYSYVWTVPAGATNPGNVASFIASVAGTYSVVVTNSNLCTGSGSGILTINANPTVTVNSPDICAIPGSATITATPFPAGTYSYVWTVPSGATNPGNVATFSASVVGAYSVVVTDGNSCTGNGSGTLTINANPTVAVNSPVICAGAGLATITATPSPAGTYNYVWTVPAGATNPGNVASFNASIAGTYSVVVADGNSCTGSGSGTLTINANPTVTVNSPVICASAGSAIITATPSPAGTYSYVWTVPAGATNPGNVAGFSASIAGTYSVVVTNGNSCAGSGSGILTIDANPTVTVNSPVICANAGSATITATPSPAGTYSYVWTVPSGAADPGNVASFSASIAGTYGVVITGVNSCTGSGSGTLTVNANPLAPVGVNQTSCPNQPFPALTVTVGTGVTADWYDAPTGGNNKLTGNTSYTPGGAGTYYAEARNSTTGCISTTRTAVTLTLTVLPVATVTGNGQVCQGGTEPDITFTGNNGTSPYAFTYRINNGAFLTVSSQTGQNSVTVKAPTGIAGTFVYELINVSDAGSSCVNSISNQSATLTVNASPNAPVAGNLSVCYDGSVHTASASVNTGEDVVWYTAATGGSLTSAPAGSAVNTYTAYAAAKNTTTGCESATRTLVTLTIHALPNVPVGGDITVCYDGLIHTGSATVGSGEAVVWYTASSGGTVTSAPSGSAAGTYSAWAAAKNTTPGCESTNRVQVTLTIVASPAAPVNLGDKAICAGQSMPVLAVSVGPGETADWYPTASGGLASFINTLTITPGAPGIYYAESRNVNINNCVSTSRTAVKLTMNPLPSAVISGNNTICPGGSTNLFVAMTGTPNWTLTYTDGTTPVTITSNSPSYTFAVSPAANATYTVTNITDASNCSNTGVGSAVISIRPIPTATISGTTTVCLGDAAAPVTFYNPQPLNIIVTYKISGGTGQTVTVPANSSAAVTQGTSTAGVFSYDLTSVQYQSVPGCTYNVTGQTAVVTVLEKPVATISGTTIVCQDESQPNITFTNPQLSAIVVTYTINGGANQQITVPAGSTSTFAQPTNVSGVFKYDLVSVTYQNGSSCSNPVSGSASITVTVKPTATISGGATVCQNSVFPDISITNPMALPITVNYTINGAPATQNISAGNTFPIHVSTVTPGAFVYDLVSVRYQSGSGCQGAISGSATVTVLATPVTTISGTATVCQGGAQPGITFTNPQPVPISVTYTINGLNQATIDIPGTSAVINAPVTAEGMFTYNVVSVSYINGPGCSNNLSGVSATITVLRSPNATISGNTTVCQNFSPSPNINITNPEPLAITVNYTKNGIPDFLNLQAGETLQLPVITTTPGSFTYSLTSVHYSNGPNCTVNISGNATVEVLPTPAATIIGTASVCQGSAPDPNVSINNPQSRPITITYSINGTNQPTVDIPANSNHTIQAPTGTAGIFNYVLVNVTYQGVFSCVTPITGTAVITITPKPVATATPASQTICSGNPTSVVLTGSVTGTTFAWTVAQTDVSGATAGSGSSISQVLTATGSGAGTAVYTVTPTANGCTGDPITVTVTVNKPPVVTCPVNPPPVCLTASLPLTGATPAGGTYSGAGVNSNTFYANVAGVGTHSITYTVTDPATNCTNSCNFTITVIPAPVIPNQPATSICDKATFVVSPQDGIPVGTIVPVGTTYSWTVQSINPAGSVSGAGPGSGTSISQTLILTNSTVGGTVTYLVTPQVGTCNGTSFTVSVAVVPKPILNATYFQGDYGESGNHWENCAGQSGELFNNDLDIYVWQNGGWLRPPNPGTFTPPNYDSFGWQHSYGSVLGPWEKTDVTVGEFYQYPMTSQVFKEPGIHYYRFFVTKNGCITYSDTITFTMTSDYLINAGGSNEITCNSVAAIPLTGSSITSQNTTPTAFWSIYSLDPGNSSSGTLSYTGYTNNPSSVTYTPPANYVGTITLMLTSQDPDGAGPCTAITDTRDIIINPSIIAFAGDPQTVCAGGSVLLNGNITGTYTGFTWSAPSGAFTNENTLTPTYTPGIPSGPVTVTLTPIPSNSCTQSSTVAITVNPAPQATPVLICQGAAGQPLTSATNCPSGTSISVGPRLTQTGATGGGAGTQWTNPGNIISDNNQYATVILPGNGNSQNLNATNFGFNIPAGATIVGITVQINRYGSSTNNNGIRDVAVQLLGGTLAGDNKAITGTNWSTSNNTVITYGGVNDPWGNTWTPTQINAAGFGVTLDTRNANTSSNRTASVDYIRVTVTYSVVAALNWYTVLGGGTPVGSGSSFNPINVPAVLAAGYPYSNLANTNIPGTYTFYVECTTYGGCRTPVNYVISSRPTVTKPAVFTASSCTFANQAALDLAYSNWLGSFNATGGTNLSWSKTGETPAGPLVLCAGGTKTVTWHVNADCENTDYISTFTITPPAALSISKPADVNTVVCSFTDQAAVNTAFSAWLAEFAVTGGCASQGSFNGGTPAPPNLCGGSVTATYTVTDQCGTSSVTATFAITGTSSVTITPPADVTKSACDFADQAAVNTAFNLWVAGFNVSQGGCPGSVTYGSPSAPLLCTGGTTEVNYLYKDVCTTKTASARFTVTLPTELVVNKPVNVTRNSCDFADQSAADAAFATWLAGFGFGAGSGCSPTGSIQGTPVAPNLCAGGTVNITYNYTDKCKSGSVTASFTLNMAVPLTVNKPSIFIKPACNYASQAALDDEFVNWLTGFYAIGGCSPSGSFATPPVAPLLCNGGTTTVNYIVTDRCGTTTVSSDFVIQPPAALVIQAPGDFVAPACSYTSQNALKTAFDTWLATFKVTSGGCNPQPTIIGNTIPNWCSGGTANVTYQIDDVCGSTSLTRQFMVNPALPLTVIVPADVHLGPEKTQAEIDAAFLLWKSQFGHTGGCNVTATDISTVTAPGCSAGTSVIINYSVSDGCGNADNRASTFDINCDNLHYRTIKSGNWIDPSCWETNRFENFEANPAFTGPALVYPTASRALTIKVRNSHLIDVNNTDNIPVDQVTVEAGGMVNINAGGTMQNIGAATDFVIKSEPEPAAGNGSGSLIVDGTYAGPLKYIRWTDLNRFYIVSSPVAGQPVDATYISDFGLGSGLRQYNEPSNTWGGYTTSGSLGSGIGYIIKRTANPEGISFSGTPTVGTIQVPVTSSKTKYGWNSVGNPYTSAINIKDGIKGFIVQNLAVMHPGYGAVYLWNALMNNYFVINLIGYYNGTWHDWYGFDYFPDAYVQAGQGFLVNIVWPSPASPVIVFNRGMQEHSTATSLKKAGISWPGITLVAQNGNQVQGTIITFYYGGTTGLDPGYDAGILNVSPFQIYSRAADGTSNINLAIQTLPDNRYDQLEIPIGIDSPSGGRVTFRADGIILPDGLFPVLEDKLLQTNTPLKSVTDSCTVTIPPNTYGTGRFYIRFSNVTPVKVIELQEIKYSAWFGDRKIVIFGKADRETKATLYDLSGRKLGEYNLTDENRNEIPAQGLVTGVYLLQIQSPEGRQVIKVPVVY